MRAFSRRRLLALLGRSALCGPALMLVPRPGIARKARKYGRSGIDPEMVAGLVRDLFPHDHLGAAFYRRTAAAVLSRAIEATGAADQLGSGMDRLNRLAGPGGWGAAAESARLEILGQMEGEPFFEFVRTAAIEILYRDPGVWRLLGYGGNALAQGGYLARGFNDIAWLPEGKR
ncbi:MAG: hypothetical protein HYY36_04720 [Gammaproteobacteria bacterium]|nr:hypothetical protein [Gammaproteobacteria bacterium]